MDPKRGGEVDPIRRPAMLREVDPATTAQHPIRASGGAVGIDNAVGTSVVGGSVPVSTPLPHIATQVVQTQLIGSLTPYHVWLPPLFASVQPTLFASLLPENVYPWLLLPPRAAYSHSASVGNRYNFPFFLVSHSQ